MWEDICSDHVGLTASVWGSGRVEALLLEVHGLGVISYELQAEILCLKASTLNPEALRRLGPMNGGMLVIEVLAVLPWKSEGSGGRLNANKQAIHDARSQVGS